MHGLRRRHHTEEDESVFVSMTDITVSFLFIVMLLLAYFAKQYSEKVKEETVPKPIFDKVTIERDVALKNEKWLNHLVLVQDAQIDELRRIIDRLQVKNPLEEYVRKSDDARRRLVTNLAAKINADIMAQKVSDISVAISTQGDALRFQGSGLFASDKSDLVGRSRAIISLLGKHLADELPCFTLGRGQVQKICNEDFILIDTVQIEGHTDSTNGFDHNLDLSNDRARVAFNVIAPEQNNVAPDMLGFENLLQQPVLAVAGYGKTRPISTNETDKGRAENRRIDLRFIMYVPKGLEYVPHTVDDIERIRVGLTAAKKG